MVSHWPNQRGGTYGLYQFNRESRKLGNSVYDTAEWHEVDAVPLAPRERPRGRSTVVDEKTDSAVLYCMNVYTSDRPEAAAIPKGSIKKIRVIEGLPSSPDDPLAHPLGEGSNYYNATPFGRRRILGLAPVEEDGSFHITVPANIPIYLQLLDDNNFAQATLNGWIWAKPREKRGCIGCHEDRELTPPNIMVKAVARPAVSLMLPPEKRRTVDFVHNIAPIIERRCLTAGCHVSGGVAPDLTVKPPMGPAGLTSIFGEPYATLIDGKPRKGPHLVPGSAEQSPLIWHLGAGRAKAEGREYLTLRQPSGPLDELEYLTFIEWVDLGAQYNNRDAGGQTLAGVPPKGSTP